MEVDIRGTVLYPIFRSYPRMNIREMSRIVHRRNIMKPFVRAATIINRDSVSGVIDAHNLSRPGLSIIHYVDIAESNGRIYCVNGDLDLACWMKNITLAKDCQSSNVILMNAGNGVYLKTIRLIYPGEPLLMWFAEDIILRMNIDCYLKPFNIQGENLYTCHVCGAHFEHPNPLKIHLALECNRYDMNFLWRTLARQFQIENRSSLPSDYYPRSSPPTFNFQLTTSPSTSPARMISPIAVETLNSSASPMNLCASPTSPNSSQSPRSLGVPSPGSSTQVSPISLAPEILPIHGINSPESAFQRYVTTAPVYENHVIFSQNIQENYHHQQQQQQQQQNHYLHHHNPVPQIPAIVPIDEQAEQMETIVSNMGRSRNGHLCIYCGKLYSRKYGLKIHIRTHTGYKPLRCKHCSRPFGDPSNLNKHVRLHLDTGNPYNCNLCDKVLVRRRDLERHIKSKHPVGKSDNQPDDNSGSGIVNV